MRKIRSHSVLYCNYYLILLLLVTIQIHPSCSELDSDGGGDDISITTTTSDLSKYEGLYSIKRVDVVTVDGDENHHHQVYEPPVLDSDGDVIDNNFLIRVFQIFNNVKDDVSGINSYRISGTLGEGNSFVIDIDIFPNRNATTTTTKSDGNGDDDDDDDIYDEIVIHGDMVMTEFKKDIPPQVKQFEEIVEQVIPNATSIAVKNNRLLIIEGSKGKMTANRESHDFLISSGAAAGTTTTTASVGRSRVWLGMLMIGSTLFAIRS